MLSLSFESTLREWERGMDALERDLMPEATADALNWTAAQVRDDLKGMLPSVFDRPTRFTVGSLMMEPASPQHLVSTVRFRDTWGSRHYLWPQVSGGNRPLKRFEQLLISRGIMKPGEYAVPGKRAPLDASGNIRAGLLMQILSQLGAMGDQYANETKRSRKRAGPGRLRYFVPGPGKWERLHRGIWLEAPSPLPIIMFVRAPSYRIRFRFHDIAAGLAAEVFPSKFDRALTRVVDRTRTFGRSVRWIGGTPLGPSPEAPAASNSGPGVLPVRPLRNQG